MTSQMTDFGNSYMTWVVDPNPDDKRVPGHRPGWGNSARILIDARATIIDDTTGNTEELYLVAPCRTEWMYRDTGMIQNPSGEYRVIFSSAGRSLYVGKRIDESTAEGPLQRKGSNPYSPLQKSIVFTIRDYPEVTDLPDDEAIVQATEQMLPINARTELRNEKTGRRAILEYPIRTMNIQQEYRRFQVDNGPLIYIDLENDAEHLLDTAHLAHAVYNTLDYAEFVLKCPTPLIVDGNEVAKIFHYSDYRNHAVKHTFYAAGRLA
jgi:hypothetical protein